MEYRINIVFMRVPAGLFSQHMNFGNQAEIHMEIFRKDGAKRCRCRFCSPSYST